MGNSQAGNFKIYQRWKNLDQPRHRKANVEMSLAAKTSQAEQVCLSYLLRPPRRLQVLSCQHRSNGEGRMRDAGTPGSCQFKTGAEDPRFSHGRQPPACEQVVTTRTEVPRRDPRRTVDAAFAVSLSISRPCRHQLSCHRPSAPASIRPSCRS